MTVTTPIIPETSSESVAPTGTLGPSPGVRFILRRGQRLFNEGDSADAAYMIQKGRLEVTKRVRDDETVLALLGPGDIVGEMALIDDMPRSASVRAVEDTYLLRVSKDNFQERMQGLDPVYRAILNRLSNRLRQQSIELAMVRKIVR